jgi:hypothetical protein
MDGQNIHGYLPEDNSYDDLLNTSSWPASNEQQYSYSQPTQDQYRFPANQAAFDHFDMSQHPSYPQVTYSNSPYATQYQQHARPSDVFGQDSYIMDPSQGSGSYGQENTFSFAPQRIENITISPQSLQYNLSQSQPVANGGLSGNSFPQLVNNPQSNFGQRSQNSSPVYQMDPSNGNLPPQPQRQSTQVQYPDLSAAATPVPQQGISTAMGEVDTNRIVAKSVASTRQYTTPPKVNPLRVVHPEVLAETPSSQRLAYAPFITWDDTPIQVASGPKRMYIKVWKDSSLLNIMFTGEIPDFKLRKAPSERELIPGFDISREFCHTLDFNNARSQ